MLSYERTKALEQSLGPQAEAVIAAFQELGDQIEQIKPEVKKDLVAELATKADIATLGGEIKRLEASTKADIATLGGEIRRFEGEIKRLDGRIETEAAKLEGKFARLEVFMKVLIGLAILGMAMFSPNAAELIRLLK